MSGFEPDVVGSIPAPATSRKAVPIHLPTTSRKEDELQTETVATGMPAIMGAMDTIVELMGKVWTLMTSNPLLTLMVATALIPVGVGAFCAIRNAARG